MKGSTGSGRFGGNDIRRVAKVLHLNRMKVMETPYTLLAYLAIGSLARSNWPQDMLSLHLFPHWLE